ncbi:MAG: hypothetical protein Q9225_004866 [Loekoesia sp. 1 TL-2023]
MAPVRESTYFPPLDKCLDGRHQLFSWKTTYIGLKQLEDAPTYGSLEKHLTDSQTLELLKRSLSPSSPPTAQTRSSFETKTSAINIVPSAQGRYNIKQIQDDSLWLSAEARIDEVAALRLVILEWQTRPAAQLRDSSLADDIPGLGGSIRGSILQPVFSASTLLLRSQPLQDRSVSIDYSQDTDARRTRLLEIYLTESRFRLETCKYLVFTALCRAGDGTSSASRHSSLLPVWVETVGHDIFTSWDIHGVSKLTGKNILISGIDAIRSRIKSLEDGCGWFRDKDEQKAIQGVWSESQILEMLAIMEIMLVNFGALTQLSRSDVVLAWYKLMSDYGFFEVFEPVSKVVSIAKVTADNKQPFRELYDTHEWQLQSLTSLVSLAVLRIPFALHMIESLSATTGSAEETVGGAAYLLNADTCNEVTEVLVNAASERLQVASPAVLAWSIILQTLREQAFQSRDSRENRRSIMPSERSETADSPESESVDYASIRSNMLSLHRRSSTGSDTPQQQTFLELLLDKCLLVPVDGDPVAFLARAAVDGSRVLNIVASLSVNFCTPFGLDHRGKLGLKMRHILLDLIKASLQLIDYQPDLLVATLAVLTGSESYWNLRERPLGYREAEPASIFLENRVFMQKLFYEALYRFPYETMPFVRLCRALAICYTDEGKEGISAVLPNLEKTDSFTFALPVSFTTYQLIQNDEESSSIQLTANLEIVEDARVSQPRLPKRSKQSHDLVMTQTTNLRQIPRGTVGRVLSESKPLVVLWNHECSPLAYLCMLLSSALSRDPVMGNDPQSNDSLPKLIPEIIDLLSITLLTATKGASEPKTSFSAVEVVQGILNTASEGLDGGQDIVSVVFDIFEQELSRQPKSTDELSLSVLIRCVQFMQVLLQVMPDRVWPYLGRSGLLGMKDGNSQLSAVLVSTEIAVGKYDFLLGCIHLFQSLVDDAITHAVVCKSPAKAATRFAAQRSLGSGVSQVVMKKVLLSFQRTMLDVYQSSSSWGFVGNEQKFEANARLCETFHQLLTYCFGIEDQPAANQKLSASLMPAAEHIVDVFLSTSGSEITLANLISTIRDGVAETRNAEPQSTKYWIQQTVSTLKFAYTLLRLNTMLGYPRSRLEEQMLRSVSLLARTYTSYPLFRQPAIELLDVLVQNADLTEGQPASLLGYMGEEAAKHFLEVLAMADEPLRDRDLSVSIWKFLSEVVSKRQQWLAISVLTSEAPRKVIKKKESEPDSHNQADSIFKIALDRLSSIERLQPQTASAMLEFVALAADSWPWIWAVTEKHPHFLTALTEYIGQVETVSNTTQNRSNQAGIEYYKIQMTSYITEILAMYAHYTRQAGNTTWAKDLLSNLTYLTTNAVVLTDFNVSLHSNLRQNFEARFDNCKLTAFKRTVLKPALLGNSFYYDLEIAGQMLKLDSSWTGKDKGGFAAEISRANVNLSIVEAQISLFNSWKFLAVELSKSLKTDVGYQTTMAEVIMDCLRTNAQNTLPQMIFERLAQSRADLAFTLLQTLIEVQSSQLEVKSVLFTAWDAMRAHGTDLTIVLDGDGASYCRTLLKILCLSIQAHTSSRTSSDPADRNEPQSNNPSTKPSAANATLRTVLEILRTTVAHGFRALTTLLHDSPHSVLPSDFALLSALLRNSLRIPGLDRHTTALLSTFADAQTSRYASTLLSWSDQLATNRDPIYGELSINFLLEMSSMPALAESLAVEGILNHICNTNLIKFLRTNKGMGPFDQPVRMYTIWVRGILPLLLNLLHAVGASMAAEIATCLNQFSNQIARANAAFTFYSTVNGTEGCVTLGMISEAQTLGVITEILDTYREAGPSAGVVSAEIMDTGWDRVRIREDVESWLQRRNVLRERIVPVGEREDGWMRMKSIGDGKDGLVNRLEQKVVEEMGLLLMLVGGKEE